MKLNRRQLCVAAMLACVVVAGCDRKTEERNKAAGEVLEGTISDAMIAPDRVRSQPPIAPHKAESPAASGGKAVPKETSGAIPVDSPTPEASPAAEASPTPKPTASEPVG